MKKESLLNYLYRFFDIIVLLFIVFDFGYDFEENYNSPHVIGLIFLSLLLLSFNIFKFIRYKFKSNKKIALLNLVNIVILGVFLFASLIVSFIHLDYSSGYILQKIKPILEGGLIFYFLIKFLL